VVLNAGSEDPPLRTKAREELCRVYWAPIYAFIRRMGHRPHDAQDLTQSFWQHLLERNSINKVEPHLGKFRSFLLASLKLFLKDQRDRDYAVKRGGQARMISLDEAEAEAMEHQFQLANDPGLTAEQLYDQRWAIALLNKAFQRLESELQQAHKTGLFQVLKPFLSRMGSEEDYAQASRSSGLSPGAVATAVHRLRKRYGELVREEVARTVPDSDDLEAELRYCRAIFSNNP
jgi:RNA polymerase sigma factor (sigma-70 family)